LLEKLVVDPKISIIIRTLNEEKHLGALLDGIESQSYTNWEIINVDSGSTDRTPEIIGPRATKLLHIPAKEFTFGRSLNIGCAAASGEYLIIASGHVYPLTNTWLENLVLPFNYSSIGMVYGRQRGVPSTRIGEERDLLKIFGSTAKILIDEPFSHNGNSAVRRELWADLPFDESLTGLEDMDWAKKIQKKGFTVGYAADAAVYHVHTDSLKAIYRRYRGEGIAYKSIFPGVTFNAANCARAVFTDTVRDLLYGISARKHPTKLMEVPAARLAHHLGVYDGINLQKKKFKDLPNQLRDVPQKSKSVIITGPGHHSLEEGQPPQVGVDEVLIQVAYSGVCSADISLMQGTNEGLPKSEQQYPLIPGQEYSGVVVKFGDSVQGFKTGDKVVGEWNLGSDVPFSNASDDSSQYLNTGGTNLTNLKGCYSEYISAPGNFLHRLPSDIPLRYSTMVKGLAGCLQGLDELSAHPGESAYVLGAGTLGNFCAQVLVARGLNVTVTDSNERWLKLLQKYDANTLRQQTNLKQFQYIIEASGNRQSLESILDATESPAKVLLLAPSSLDDENNRGVAQSALGSSALKVNWDCIDQKLWDRAIRMIKEGTVNLQDHVDTVLPLEEYEKAWEVHQDKQQLNVLLNANKELAQL
jgi:rhamnosyltransferase